MCHVSDTEKYHQEFEKNYANEIDKCNELIIHICTDIEKLDDKLYGLEKRKIEGGFLQKIYVNMRLYLGDYEVRSRQKKKELKKVQCCLGSLVGNHHDNLAKGVQKIQNDYTEKYNQAERNTKETYAYYKQRLQKASESIAQNEQTISKKQAEILESAQNVARKKVLREAYCQARCEAYEKSMKEWSEKQEASINKNLTKKK